MLKVKIKAEGTEAKKILMKSGIKGLNKPASKGKKDGNGR
jgi:hypothetical protein